MQLTDIHGRFFSKISKTDYCWEWIAYRHHTGRGMFRVKGAMKYAPRVSWELHNGSIPDGLHVLHKCDNPGCVNPEHLFLGDHLMNMVDMKTKGRSNKPLGESNGRCKTPLSTVKEIKLLLKQGLSAAEIRDLGYNYYLVRSIKSGKNWSWFEV